ncbi:membrane protein [Lentzea aerocolonigenes]|uniref:Membrane protein n=1 Tax=Lentzea aerocolonigenes TaxID=68170 RepID=A0A0F0GZ30_LENAE|nr:murein biosynthesis integral membrane protein MurJ [Lentzea aerocolonigenes]KJK47267.1 membrane protein [Lentzea aerocolonigenes]
MSETATTTEPEQQKQAPSVAKASGSMAIATIVSRATGLLSKVLLVAVIGGETLGDSYQAASTLPTMINELLLGGVLTSVAIPLLVRAEKEDGDGGESYAQWLITMGTLILGIGTVLAMVCAPLLTDVYISDSPTANAPLVTAFAYLVLPGIVFYGLTALLSAVLNARHVFGIPTWAPVLNNLVVIVVLAVYAMLPGEMTLNPVRMTDVHLLVLGLGTALGVAVQASVLVPALKKTGFHFKWRFGWDSRLSEFGNLAFWVLLYVGLGLASMTVLTNVATNAKGTLTAFNYQWLIAQVPYGVLGVSLLTALMPKMSRAAAHNDNDSIVRDLLFGNRMSSILLMPFSALMTVSGVSIGLAAFAYGEAGVVTGTRIGLALSLSAFSLVPYAVTLLQLRVFYAMKDARTPTYIQAMMVAVRIGLLYLFLAVAEPGDATQLAVGVSLAMSLSFVFGAVVGQVWLRIRLGRLRTGFTIWTVCLTVVASSLAFAVAKGVNWLIQNGFGISDVHVASWVEVVVVTLIGLPLAFGLLAAFRVPEMKPAIDKINRLVRRR